MQDTTGTNFAFTTNDGIADFAANGTVTISTPFTLGNTATYVVAKTGGTLVVSGNVTAPSGLSINVFAANDSIYGVNNLLGTVILSGNNAITGVATVNGGTMQLAGTGANLPLGGTSRVTVVGTGILLYGASNQIPTATPMTLNGGTFNVNGQSQDRAHTLGALTLSSSAALDFGAGASTISMLAFGNSSGVAWSGTLSVYDYRGTATGGGTDQLFFGGDGTGLSAAQLGEISFYSGGAGSTLLGTGLILSNGEVTYNPASVPEPATWFGGILLLGMMCKKLRHRSRSKLAR